MKILDKISLKTKLTISFLLVSFISIFIISAIIIGYMEDYSTQVIFDKLMTANDTKRNEIVRYFENINHQVVTFSENKMIINAIKEFSAAYKEVENQLGDDFESNETKYQKKIYERYKYQKENTKNIEGDIIDRWTPKNKTSLILQNLYIASNPHPIGSKEILNKADSSSLYDQIHEKYHPIIRSYLKKFGYYDIFLIEPRNGNIIYSVFKEVDFATSLFTGPYKNTNFARVVNKAFKASDPSKVFFEDFEFYEPSYNDPASFIASAIYDSGKLIGVLCFQMPVDRVNSIMKQVSGLGKTGESFLLGDDGLMRSNSRFSEKNSILTQKIPLLGKEQEENKVYILKSYRDANVLSIYNSFSLNGVKWFIKSNFNTDEAYATINKVEINIIIIAIIVFIFIFFGSFISLGKTVAPIMRTSELLDKICSHLKDVSNLLAESSDKLSKASLSQGAATQESVASMQEISSMVSQTHDFANKTRETTIMTKKKSEKGNQVTEKLTCSMSSINELAQHLQEMVDIMNAISNETNIIDDIVFKTQLLSFNASIEAARAGQYGKGFSVVAEEVGSLAAISSNASTKIKNLLISSKRRAENLVQSTQVTIKDGSSVTSEAVMTFKEIADQLDKINIQVDGIFQASSEQQEGIKQSNIALVQLEKLTNDNSKISSQTKEYAQEIDNLNNSLQKGMKTLKKVVLGKSNDNFSQDGLK